MRLARNLWYPIAESREFGARPTGLRRLGVDLVLWRRNDGAVVVQDDRCPHLGAALSHGTVEDGCITCPFHGMRFDSDGRCTLVPSMGARAAIPEVLRARTYPAREAHGFVWMWWGDAAPSGTIPFFEELESGWSHATTQIEWRANYTRAIENQLDVAHLAFVHRTTIGMGGRSRIEGPHVQVDEDGIQVWGANKRDDGLPTRSHAELAAAFRGQPPTLHFKFPGIWRLRISPRMVHFVAFVPVDEDRVLYYLRTYRAGGAGLLSWLMHRITAALNNVILKQDQRVVLTQSPLNSLDCRDDHLVPADRAIMEYRLWLARNVAGE